MGKSAVICEGENLLLTVNGHACILSWHGPQREPEGVRHGSAGICVTGVGDIVLVSDGMFWDLPGGRPEGQETWRQTLDREFREEACGTVRDARLLGFCHSHILEGPEAGLELVRSFWRTEVELGSWQPLFEMTVRRAFPASDCFQYLEPVFEPVFRRAFIEAGLI